MKFEGVMAEVHPAKGAVDFRSDATYPNGICLAEKPVMSVESTAKESYNGVEPASSSHTDTDPATRNNGEDSVHQEETPSVEVSAPTAEIRNKNETGSEHSITTSKAQPQPSTLSQQSNTTQESSSYVRDFNRVGKAYSPKDSILQREAQRQRECAAEQQELSEEERSPLVGNHVEHRHQDFLEKLHQQVERLNTAGFQKPGVQQDSGAKRQLFPGGYPNSPPLNYPDFLYRQRSNSDIGPVTSRHSEPRVSPEPLRPHSNQEQRIDGSPSNPDRDLFPGASHFHRQVSEGSSSPGSFHSSPRETQSRGEHFPPFGLPPRFLAPPPLQRPDGSGFPQCDPKALNIGPDFQATSSHSLISEGKEFFFCHLCSYVGNSKYLFNAHMNSHFEHRCPNCDYTSRTEGRLKRHIKDFHSQSPPENYSGNQITMRSQPGRPKVFKCKQCEFSSTDKIEFWEHARQHIKDDKVLQCPKCPFVTEYKHHLEYHLRNHFGSKPFKCPKCNYSCVNKSMLNSHMKSHTNVYQYRCADCTYATKYCHSLKLHLKKYQHKPATVLNPDGSLPTDGSGDFELVSKRGPPRGPRGPRKDSKEGASPPPGTAPHMSPGFLMGPPMSPGRHMNGGGMAGGYWPMLPNAMYPPPPLIPGMPPLPLHMSQDGKHPPMPPGLAGSMAAMAAMVAEQEKAAAIANDSDGIHKRASPNGRVSKCSMCEFTAENREMLSQHMMRVHAAENHDLFQAYGIRPDTLIEGDQEGNQRRSPTPKSQYGSSPAKANGEFPLDLTASAKKDEGPWDGQFQPQSEPPKRKLEKDFHHLPMSEPPKRRLEDDFSPEHPNEDSPASGSLSPTPRKRSRKGKAYKLDTICLKLQERYSPEVEDYEDSNEACMSDYASDRDVVRGSESEATTPVEGGMPETEPKKESSVAQKHSQMAALLSDDRSRGISSGPEESGDSDSNALVIAEAPVVGTKKVQLNHNGEIIPEEGGEEAVQRMLELSTALHRQRALYNSPNLLPRQAGPDTNGSLSNGIPTPRHEGPEELSPPKSDAESCNGTPLKAPERNSNNLYECNFCEISFKDCIMYTMHMGYHGYHDPFKCNMCGHQADNRVEFFLHIARAAHA